MSKSTFIFLALAIFAFAGKSLAWDGYVSVYVDEYNTFDDDIYWVQAPSWCSYASYQLYAQVSSDDVNYSNTAFAQIRDWDVTRWETVNTHYGIDQDSGGFDCQNEITVVIYASANNEDANFVTAYSRFVWGGK